MTSFFQSKPSVLIPLSIGADMEEAGDAPSRKSLLGDATRFSPSSFSLEALKETILARRTCLLYSLIAFLLALAFYGTFFPRHNESWGAQMRVTNATTATDQYGNTWIESTIGVNGIMIDFFHSVPSRPGLPKLVFFHGGGTSGLEGVDLFASFAADFEVICPSARGFGKSTRAPPFGTAQMVMDGVALLPLLGTTGEKFFLVAHSMGATVAPRVAKATPDLVAALVLEDPGWLRLEGEDPSKNRPGYRPRGGDDLSNESVEKITVPTLILTAEFGDGVPEVIDATLATYTNGTKHYFKGAGHCIHCQSSSGYLGVVREYLSQHLP